MFRPRRIATRYFLIALLSTYVCAATPLLANPKLAFWDQPQRKGANQFNKASRTDWYVAGRDLGLQFVRLVPDKWKAAERDFLIGNCDDFTAVNESDFAKVKAALDDAHAHGHKVVFGMLSLPGCRWRQLNDGEDDYRLWQDERYQRQAAAFWRELASRLKDHPAVVAYNPLNEPHPERADGIDGDAPEKLAAWIAQHRGKSGDLDAFNRRIVAAIRGVDRDTPVLVEGYGHGNVAGLAALTPIDDAAILYSLHFYEPWNYTSKRANGGKYAYPDRMPQSWNGPSEPWTSDHLRKRLQPATDWAKRHAISPTRIVAAEFGCQRDVEGAPQYLADVISLLNGYRWHWAFYAYREDAWDGMDYELGTGKLPWSYWQAVERGEAPDVPRKDNPLWDVIKREFPAKPE
jgi:endoglucanase